MDPAGWTRLSRWRVDRGETLIELLVALSILSVAGVAILTGVMLSVKTSDIHRKESTGGAYVRSFAEAIQNHVDQGAANYRKCAAANVYRDAVSSGAWRSELPAARFDLEQAAAEIWTAAGWTTTCSATTDGGVQRVSLTVKAKDGRATERLTLILRQPCNQPGAAPCG